MASTYSLPERDYANETVTSPSVDISPTARRIRLTLSNIVFEAGDELRIRLQQSFDDGSSWFDHATFRTNANPDNEPLVYESNIRPAPEGVVGRGRISAQIIGTLRTSVLVEII